MEIRRGSKPVYLITTHLIVLHADKEENKDALEEVKQRKEVAVESCVRTSIDKCVSKDPRDREDQQEDDTATEIEPGREK